ncbi:flavoprotein [Ideonella sp. YS5]|jgi:dihydromethanopterin reductase (acceptor)|uniref:flavoprotein n=1 Tax=Ideonella sp. YS5 TaxID=3453714 RepID=UPI003F6F1F66
MSAETPSTASSTSFTSRSPTPTEAQVPAAEPRAHGARVARESGEDDLPLLDSPPRSRFAWCVTGSGHFLEESMALAARLPAVDLFLSAAAEEVLPLYKLRLEELKKQFRVIRDRTASGVPVGMLYEDIYHTVVVAPATSNTVAKCAFGISDSLPTNMFAQAGKLGILGIVFACDTEPVVVTKSPHDWVTLRPRRIELSNVERLREIDYCQVVSSPADLEAALEARLKELSLAWNTSSS